MIQVSKSMSPAVCQSLALPVLQVGATDRGKQCQTLARITVVFELKRDRPAQFHTVLVVASPNKGKLGWLKLTGQVI